MERVRRLYGLWGWIPAFRVVAETEHLPTASVELGVTPQALSRSIKLLEEQVGKPLFRRAGRRIQLNEDGKALLHSIRDSMRVIDEGLVTLLGEQLTGPIHVAALAEHAWLFLKPALAVLRHEHPDLVPTVLGASGRDARNGLRTGALDVVIDEQIVEDDALTVQRLTQVGYGVFCGAAHPPFGRDDVSEDEIARHAFVVPADSRADGWPPALPRRIGARVSSLQLALEMLWDGELLAIMPDAIARVDGLRRPLHRLPIDCGPARTLYVATRRSVGEHRRIEVVLEALRHTASRLAG